MKRDSRQGFGTPPTSGLRFEHRAPLAVPATLHVNGAAPQPVTLADLSSRGCRLAVASDLPVAVHCALMLDGRSLISGRVAWNSGTGIGVDFCTPLLPRVVAQLNAAGTRA